MPHSDMKPSKLSRETRKHLSEDHRCHTNAIQQTNGNAERRSRGTLTGNTRATRRTSVLYHQRFKLPQAKSTTRCRFQAPRIKQSRPFNCDEVKSTNDAATCHSKGVHHSRQVPNTCQSSKYWVAKRSYNIRQRTWAAKTLGQSPKLMSLQ